MIAVSEDMLLIQGHTADHLQIWDSNIHLFHIFSLVLVSFPFHHVGKCLERAEREGCVCVLGMDGTEEEQEV